MTMTLFLVSQQAMRVSEEGLCSLSKLPCVPMFPQYFLKFLPCLTYLLTTFPHLHLQHLVIPVFPQTSSSSLQYFFLCFPKQLEDPQLCPACLTHSKPSPIILKTKLQRSEFQFEIPHLTLGKEIRMFLPSSLFRSKPLSS